MVKGIMAVPKLELLLSTLRVWRGPGYRAGAGRAPCSARGTLIQEKGQLPTLQGSPVLCQPLKHCGAGDR